MNTIYFYDAEWEFDQFLIANFKEELLNIRDGLAKSINLRLSDVWSQYGNQIREHFFFSASMSDFCKYVTASDHEEGRNQWLFDWAIEEYGWMAYNDLLEGDRNFFLAIYHNDSEWLEG